MPGKHQPTAEERDERVSVPLDPEELIAGALAVDPEGDASKREAAKKG